MNDDQASSNSDSACTAATELYRNIARNHQRIEVMSSDGPCVIISKAELESLERALQILSDTEKVRRLCASLSRVANACNGTQTHA